MSEDNRMPAPELVLIDGSTGSGKSTILDYLRNTYSQVFYVGSKYTTRDKRVGDNSWEFKFVDEIPESYKKFSFGSVGKYYAVDFDEIKSAVKNEKTYVITCVDKATQMALGTYFRTIVIYVYRNWSVKDLDELFSSRASSKEDAKIRRDEVDSIPIEYMEKIENYKHVILNVGTKENLYKQLAKILASYNFRQ